MQFNDRETLISSQPNFHESLVDNVKHAPRLIPTFTMGVHDIDGHLKIPEFLD